MCAEIYKLWIKKSKYKAFLIIWNQKSRILTCRCLNFSTKIILPGCGTTNNITLEINPSICCTYLWPIASLAVHPSCPWREFIWCWPMIFIISFTVISPFKIINRFTSQGHQTLLYTVKKTDTAISINRSTVQVYWSLE